MSLVDIAVVDYGTPHLAARCVGSLDSDLFASIELVDAKSRGLSYAQAVNRSLARGTAPYVLALNADTRMLEPPDRLLQLFADHPDIAVIGPRQIDQTGRITHAGIIGSNTEPEHRFWMRPLAHVAEMCAEKTLDCVTVSGSVYFARRTVWEQLGGLLETPLYYEETAFSYAVRHAGYRVCYTGQTTWEHRWNSSPYEGSKAELAARSQAIFRRFCGDRGIECN